MTPQPAVVSENSQLMFFDGVMITAYPEWTAVIGVAFAGRGPPAPG